FANVLDSLVGNSYALREGVHREQRGLAHPPDPLPSTPANCSHSPRSLFRHWLRLVPVIRSGRLIMNDSFDEALERLRGTGTEVAGGIAPNHGPMGAEALVALGRDDAVVAWTDRYRRNLDLMPASNAPITKETWREGLGVIERIGDWVVFFRAQLAEDPWRSVFTEWIGRLLPATPSAGAHGLIRTAHALRGLQHAETPLRIEEFGVALAYWAAYYRKLPGVPRLAGSLDYGQALDQVPLFLRGQSRRGAPRDVYLRVMAAHSD